MKRSPLTRRTPIRAKHWGIRRGAHRSKYARRERHVAYMLAVKELPCAAANLPGAQPCDGPVEAAHTHDGHRVGFRKGDDRRTIPLCCEHHRIRGYDTYGGPFAGWTREERLAWTLVVVAATQAVIGLEGGGECRAA